MRSWKTTLSGLVAAVATALTTGVLETGELKDIVLVVAMAALGYFAKDRNVSGPDHDMVGQRVPDFIKQPPGE